MLPPFLTFAGKKEMQRLTEGAPGARYHLTENGWPDGDGWFKFCKHLTTWMDEQGLTRLLLLVDGHDDHYHLPAIMWLREHNVRLVVLTSGVTHKMQPLDVGIFGALEVRLCNYINESYGVVANKDWARMVARAYKEFDDVAATNGEHPMTAAFRHARIYPPDVEGFTDKDWARSDTRLGLSATHEDVKKAAALRLEDLTVVLNSAMSASRPDVADRLKKRIAAGMFDLNMVAPTDDDVVLRLLDKNEAKDKEEADKAQRAAKRAESQMLKKEADNKRKAAWAAKQATWAAAAAAKARDKEQSEAARAQAAAEKQSAAAKQSAPASVPPKAPSGKKRAANVAATLAAGEAPAGEGPGAGKAVAGPVAVRGAPAKRRRVA